jgi:hypothetical protein
MLGGFAFTLFGVHWQSLTLMAALLFLALAIVGLFTMRIAKNHAPAAGDPYLPWIFVAALFVPTIETNHLYHSTMTASFAVYLLLVTYLLFATFENTKKINPYLLTQVFIATVVLWLSKPNTAFAAIALNLAAAVTQPRLLLTMLAMSLLAGLAACSLLLLNGVNPMDVLQSYLNVSARPPFWEVLLPGFFIDPQGIFKATTIGAYAIIAPFAVAAAGSIKVKQIVHPSKLVSFSGVIVSLIGFATDMDIKLNDSGPAMLGCGLLVLSSGSVALKHWPRQVLRYAVVVACLAAIGTGEARIRMRINGPWAGPHYGQWTFISDPFFLEFATRQRFERILKSADRLTVNTAPGDVMFGPRLEFMYARLGIPSPKHLPMWWHPGTTAQYAPLSFSCVRLESAIRLCRNQFPPIPLPATRSCGRKSAAGSVAQVWLAECRHRLPAFPGIPAFQPLSGKHGVL